MFYNNLLYGTTYPRAAGDGASASDRICAAGGQVPPAAASGAASIAEADRMSAERAHQATQSGHQATAAAKQVKSINIFVFELMDRI